MGTINLLDAHFNPVKSHTSRSSLLSHIKQVEKKNFPRNEVFDFDLELKKRNTELTAIIDINGAVLGYLVCNRLSKTAMLSKICVGEGQRRSGIARRMLLDLIAKLQSQGCMSIQLWIDEARTPACRLYQSLGFVEVNRVQDYYSPGRTGVKKKLDLQNS